MASRGPNDPVAKTFVNVGLTSGVNKKRDAHQLQNGELLTADNVIYSQTEGQITKRNGFRAVMPQGAPFQGGPFKSIGMRDNVEPLILGQNTLNKYNSARNLSTSVFTPTQGRLSVKQIQGSSGQTKFIWPPSHASMATDGSQYICLTWCEPNVQGALNYYGVQDMATGNWIISPRQIPNMYPQYISPTTGYVYSPMGQMEPMVRYANGNFFIFWLWSGSAVVQTSQFYELALVCATLPLTNLAGGLQSNPFSLEFVSSGTSPVVYISPSNSVSYDIHFSNNNWIIGRQIFYQSPTIPLVVGTVSGTTLTQTQYGYALVAPYYTNTPQKISVKCDGPASMPYALSTNGSIHTLSPAPAMNQNTYRFTTGSFPNSPTDCMWNNGNLIWSTTQQSASYAQFNLCVLTPTCSLISRFQGTGPVQTWYLEQLSRLFVNGLPNKVYFWAGIAAPSSDTIYNSAYLIEVDTQLQTTQVICRTLYLSNQHITYGDKMRGVDVLQIAGTSQYVTTLTSALEKGSGNDAWRAYGTLNRVLFDFAPNRQPQIVSLPTGGCMIAGAYPLYYDGNDVVEAGFSNPPTADAMLASGWPNSSYGQPYVSSSSNGLVGGTSAVTPSGSVEYYYAICFVRRDAYGNVYRSSPSPVITVPCPNAFNNVQFPPYTYFGGGNVQIEFYRSTASAPGTYYKIGVAANGAQFIDVIGDGSTAVGNNTSITKNNTIYTNANELQNDPPPPIHHMVCSESRAFIIPADNRNVVWYSKLFTQGRTVEFSASLTMSEGLNSGQFTALAVLDSNLIIFKNDQILYTYGSGPDNGGGGSSFAPFQKIASDVGCIEPASVCVIPAGVVFKSRRGIELLNRSLQLQYIGAPVENLVQTNGPLSSVVVMPNFTELRFIPAQATYSTTYEGVTYTNAPTSVLCYDYAGNRWSTFSNMAAVQAVNLNNDYWWISADGSQVNIETPGVYSDNGAPIVMTLETPEIPCGSAGIQGWGRIYRMALLGDFGSAHTMNVSFAYDHQTNYTDTTAFNTTSGLISGDTVYQFRCSRLPRSVMQTLRLKFQDSGTTGQSCAISNLALEVGSKNGLAKLPPAKTV